MVRNCVGGRNFLGIGLGLRLGGNWRPSLKVFDCRFGLGAYYYWGIRVWTLLPKGEIFRVSPLVIT